jgi:hypothetical protein
MGVQALSSTSKWVSKLSQALKLSSAGKDGSRVRQLITGLLGEQSTEGISLP